MKHITLLSLSFALLFTLPGCAESSAPEAEGSQGTADQRASSEPERPEASTLDVARAPLDAGGGAPMDSSGPVDDDLGAPIGSDGESAVVVADALDGAPEDTAIWGEGDDAGDAGEVSDAAAEAWPEGLFGEQPQSAIPLPEFVALNHDGSVRGPEDLVGKPTVMWFFPFAGTPG